MTKEKRSSSRTIISFEKTFEKDEEKKETLAWKIRGAPYEMRCDIF